RSGLLDVLAEDFAQPGVQKMGGGVVAHCGLANRGVNDSVHFVAHANRLLGDDLLCANALDRVISSRYFSDDRVQFVAIQSAAITDLAAGFGVERRVIENDFAFFAGLEFLRTLAIFDDGQHCGIFGACLAISFELGFRELLVSGVRGLPGSAFPGGASASALSFHRSLEAGLIED